MSRTRNVISIATLSLFLSATGVSATTEVRIYADRPEEEPSGVAMAADVLVVRPLAFVATVLGTTLFLLGAPFAAMAGDVETPGRILVEEPADYAFKRPLGDLDF